MGVNVEGDLVDVDHQHNRLLSTGRGGNPSIQQVQKDDPQLLVYSTFRRHKAPNSRQRDRQQRARGDNCHLLYALKRKDGLRTTFGAIRRLMLHFDAIVEEMIDLSGSYDVVIPMPSDYPISHMYAKRLARRYGCEVCDSVFEKITMSAAREFLSSSLLSAAEKRKIAARLGGKDFSLKNIPTKYRQYVPPLVLRRDALPQQFKRFLSG